MNSAEPRAGISTGRLPGPSLLRTGRAAYTASGSPRACAVDYLAPLRGGRLRHRDATCPVAAAMDRNSARVDLTTPSSTSHHPER